MTGCFGFLKLKHGNFFLQLDRQSGVMQKFKNERVWSKNARILVLSLGLKPYSKGDVTYVRGRGACLVSLTAGSPCPGFCTDMKGAINEIHARGGTGVGPPLVYLAVHGHASGTWINEWLNWRVISGESEVEHMKRKSGVDKRKMGASDGTMLLRTGST